MEGVWSRVDPGWGVWEGWGRSGSETGGEWERGGGRGLDHELWKAFSDAPVFYNGDDRVAAKHEDVLPLRLGAGVDPPSTSEAATGGDGWAVRFRRPGGYGVRGLVGPRASGRGGGNHGVAGAGGPGLDLSRVLPLGVRGPCLVSPCPLSVGRVLGRGPCRFLLALLGLLRSGIPVGGRGSRGAGRGVGTTDGSPWIFRVKRCLCQRRRLRTVESRGLGYGWPQWGWCGRDRTFYEGTLKGSGGDRGSGTDPGQGPL